MKAEVNMKLSPQEFDLIRDALRKRAAQITVEKNELGNDLSAKSKLTEEQAQIEGLLLKID